MVRVRRRYLVLFLLVVGLLGFYWGAGAQDRPWSARPVRPPDNMEIPTPYLPTEPPKPLPNLSALPLPDKQQKMDTLVPAGHHNDSPRNPEQEPQQKPKPQPPNLLPLPKTGEPGKPGELLVPPPPMFPAGGKETGQEKINPLPLPGSTKPLPLPDPKDVRGPLPEPDVGLPKPAKDGPPRITVPAAPDPAPVTPLQPEPAKPPALRVLLPDRRFPPSPGEPSLGPGSGLPPSVPPAGTAPANLEVEKRGPAAVGAGQRVQYEIIVRNRGTLSAQRLRVEDEIFKGGRFVNFKPQAQVNGDRAHWLLDALAPGQEMRYLVEVEPTGGEDIVSSAGVTVSSISVRTQVVPVLAPMRLNLSVTGPAQATVGQPVELEIRLTNAGTQPLKGLTLRVHVPEDGLTTTWGKAVEADIKALPAGDKKIIRLPARAARAGQHVVHAEVWAGAALVTSGQTSLTINPAGLSLRQTNGARLLLGREGELQFEVANYQNQTAKNVVVTETLPEGLDFLSASDRGIYRPETRTVHWLVDALPGQQARTLTIKVQPKYAGQRSHQAIARAQGGEAITTSSFISVGGVPAVTLRVAGPDQLLEVGKETLFEIRLHNQGSAADQNLEVVAELPVGLIAGTVQGPTGHLLEGRSIRFAPLPRLEGQREAVYQVAALAQTAGEYRFKVALTSAEIRQPLSREARVRVYQD